MSYTELSDKFKQAGRDTLAKKKYAQAFIKKAKNDKDMIKQADGYVMFARLYNRNQRGISYLDSVIKLTKNIKNDKYPAEGYLLKGWYYGAKGNYELSLDALVAANTYAIKNKNTDQEYRIKYFIALLKDNLGEYEETLPIFRAIAKYYKKRYKEDKEQVNLYLNSLFALGVAYDNNGIIDSSYIINKQGLRIALKLEDTITYNNFLLALGSYKLYKKGYTSSLDSLFKYKKLFGNSNLVNQVSLTAADYQIGKILFAEGRIEESLLYLNKVDLATFETNNFFPSFREVYEILIDHYKNRNDKEKHLYYIERLLKFDSVVKKENAYVSKKIYTDYTTPQLLAEKEAIINQLETQSKDRSILNLVLSLLLLVFGGFLYYQYQKRKTYRQRFEQLVAQQNQQTVVTQQSTPTTTESIGISKEVTDQILQKLARFEAQQGYLVTKLTINTLSKKLGTNPNYLSKVVNVYKEQSFSHYINELRIAYVVSRLQEDTRFRKYTVKAIAAEIGFNSTDAFSKAFYKNTGIHPSYFIKELEKRETVPVD